MKTINVYEPDLADNNANDDRDKNVIEEENH